MCVEFVSMPMSTNVACDRLVIDVSGELEDTA